MRYLRSMRVLLDNYDSFTYNLADALWEIDPTWTVVRNDDPRALDWVRQADALVVSPGPGLPETSGVLLEALSLADGRIPVLGICLGMQALAVAQGGTLRRLEAPRHGIPGEMARMEPSRWLPTGGWPGSVGLYHSWAVDTLPKNSPWKLTAWDREEVPMAMERTDGLGVAVQFHPESVLTPHGRTWIQNWVRTGASLPG